MPVQPHNLRCGPSVSWTKTAISITSRLAIIGPATGPIPFDCNLKMKLTPQKSWQRFKALYREFPSIEMSLDLSRTSLDKSFFAKMEPRMKKAFTAMNALEKGAIANPDEGRMVGHYWLRNPAKAPTAKIRKEIEVTLKRVKAF